jgi:hypothetical protein
MVNADIEIGIIADRRGQMERAVRGGVQRRLHGGAVRLVRQQLRQPPPQPDPIGFRQCHQGVERRSLQHVGSGGREQFVDLGEIENAIADRHARALVLARWREDAERQILDREVTMRVRALNPTCPAGIMRLVDRAQGNSAFVNPAQQSS